MLFTGKGDGGTSGLYGSHERLPKDSPVYEALGTVDELNCILGICRTKLVDANHAQLHLAEILAKVQEKLFIIQAEIAGANKTIAEDELREIEASIYDIECVLTPIHSFIIPGSNEISAWLDYARTVCRKAERRVVTISHDQPLSYHSLAYLNRLSSLLYAIARYIAPAKSQKSPVY